MRIIDAVIILTAGLLAVPAADAATVYVDADASGAGDGSSWTDACTDFQAGIDSASSGDRVWVAEGTYYPTTWPNGGSAAGERHFSLKNGVSAYGGFDGTESSLDARDVDANEVVLSGDNARIHVFYHSSGKVDSTAVLDGFTVTGGAAYYYMFGYFNGELVDEVGGGMYNISSCPTLVNCTFSANQAYLHGGAVCNYNPSSSTYPTLVNCTFSGNSAQYGNGGAVYNYKSYATFDNCTFSGNTAGVNGGGMYNYYTFYLALTNCTFSGNGAGTGGGMYNENVYLSSLANCILWGNTATGNGDNVFNSDTSNAPSVSFCDIEGSGGSGGWDGSFGTDGGNNIDADPFFVSAGDPHLSTGSPCIDAGDNAAAAAITADMDGGTRIVDGDGDSTAVIDMGADEFVDTSGSVPVELSSFTAVIAAGNVLVSWTTASELDNLGFNVLRSASADGPFAQVNGALIPGAGSTALPQSYSFTDADVAAGTRCYVLEQVDVDGTVSLSNVVSVAATSGIDIPAGGGATGLRPGILFNVSGALVSDGTDAAGIYVKVIDGTAVKVFRAE